MWSLPGRAIWGSACPLGQISTSWDVFPGSEGDSLFHLMWCLVKTMLGVCLNAALNVSEAARQWVVFSMPDGSRCSSTLRNKESALLPMSPGRVLNADIEMPDKKRLMSSRALWGSWARRSFCFPFLVGMEKAMAPHSSTLAWKIPWTEEPGGLQSMGSRTVRRDWTTSLSLFTFMHWRRKWQPTPVFLPGESQGWRSLVGCHLWGRTESDTTEVT